MAGLAFLQRVKEMNASEAKDALVRFRESALRAKTKGAKVVGDIVSDAETVGTCGAMSYLRSRYDLDEDESGQQFDLFGADVSLALGSLGTILGYAGVFGNQGDHVRAVGTGALAEYAAKLGREWGEKARTSAGS